MSRALMPLTLEIPVVWRESVEPILACNPPMSMSWADPIQAGVLSNQFRFEFCNKFEFKFTIVCLFMTSSETSCLWYLSAKYSLRRAAETLLVRNDYLNHATPTGDLADLLCSNKTWKLRRYSLSIFFPHMLQHHLSWFSLADLLLIFLVTPYSIVC